jgi:hypothetical protein
VLRGFPQVFAVAPAVNLGLGSLPPERLKYASGLFNMMRNPQRANQFPLQYASTLAYADAFRAIMVAFIVATLLVPLLRNVAASPASASASH